MHKQTIAVRLLIIGGICLVIAFSYKGVLSIYFLGDDFGYLYHVANGAREGRSLSQLLDELISPPYRGEFFYRPFVVVSLLGDYLMYGVNPIGWHFTSLMLHLVNVVLLWRLVEQVVGKWHGRSSLIVGGAAALIFALRPSTPETVAWPAARGDELVLLGFLVAFLAYLRANGRRGHFYFLALGAYIFALGSKEAAVTLPGGLLALHAAGFISKEPNVGEKKWLAWICQTIKGVGPFVMILLVYFVWRFFLFGTPFKVYQDIPPIDLNNPAWRAVKLHALRFFMVPSIKMTLLAKFFLLVTSIQVLLGFITAWHSTVARRAWVFGMCWLMASLLPMAQHLFIAPTGEGARLLYIPGAALSVLLAAPLAAFSTTAQKGKAFRQHLPIAAVIGVTALICLSVPLQKDLMRPWLKAGQSMKALPAAIAARAEAVPEGCLAILVIPDHVDGALFGRNGQGALMEPPVQVRSLLSRVLVVTPPSLGQHAPRLAMSPQQAFRLEHWVWNVKEVQFERLHLREHDSNTWLDAWKSALLDSDSLWLSDELARLFN